jgi:hypothetical protein
MIMLQLDQFFMVARGNDHIETVLDQPQRQGAADAGTCSRDPGQTHLGVCDKIGHGISFRCFIAEPRTLGSPNNTH